MNKVVVNSLTLNDVSERLQHCNPDLLQALTDSMSDGPCDAFEVAIPYGYQLSKRGRITLHQYDCVHASTGQSCDLHQLLGYPHVYLPLGVVVKNNLEGQLGGCVGTTERSLTQSKLTVGNMMGVSSVLQKIDAKMAPSTQGFEVIYSGARSLIMLSKLTNRAMLQRLQLRYGIGPQVPKQFCDQVDLFYQLVHGASIDCDWASHVIFFAHSVIKRLQQQVRFKEYLINHLKDYWSVAASINHDQIFWASIVRRMSEAKVSTSSALQDPYIMNTIKHLCYMAAGYEYGHVPVDSEVCAPTQLLLKMFSEDYRIRDRRPTLMVRSKLLDEKPIYHSFAIPNHIFAVPELSYRRQTISDLRMVRRLLLWLQAHVRTVFDEDFIRSYPVAQALLSVQFDFFHPKGQDGICPIVAKLVQEDERFLYWPFEDIAAEPVDISSSFFNGCVRIKPKH